MFSRLRRTPAFHVTLLILGPGLLSASLVNNGSFEENAIGGDWAITGTLTGWSTPYNYVEIQKNGLYGAGSVAPNGVQWVELDLPLTPTGSPVALTAQIFQDVPSIVGGTYSLSFSYSPRANYGQQILGVFWGSPEAPATPLAFQVGSFGSDPSLNWQLQTYTFVATENSMRLGFGSLENLVQTLNTIPEGIDAGGNLLDNVALTLIQGPNGTFNGGVESSEVPEPATPMLIGVALLLFAVSRVKFRE